MPRDIQKHSLQSLSGQSFPKTCRTCGKVYASEFQFFNETSLVPASDRTIREISDEDDIYLEVFRNCSCGSTLMEYFSSRRDLSEKGIRKRMLFETLLMALDHQGYEREYSRSLLLEFILLFTDAHE